MKQFFDNHLYVQDKQFRYINAAENVNLFIDELDKVGLAENISDYEYLGQIHKFIKFMYTEDDGEKWIDELSEKVTNFRSGPAREVLKMHIFSHLVEDKKLQQDFAAHQVLNFCKRDSDSTLKYDSKKTQTLGESLSQILSPLVENDKKAQKAIKDASSVIAREAVSIMSEVNPEIQLKGWQKFLHNTIDKLKGIFVNDKIHDLVKGDAFTRITKKLSDNTREILPMPVKTHESTALKDRKPTPVR